MENCCLRQINVTLRDNGDEALGMIDAERRQLERQVYGVWGRMVLGVHIYGDGGMGAGAQGFLRTHLWRLGHGICGTKALGVHVL